MLWAGRLALQAGCDRGSPVALGGSRTDQVIDAMARMQAAWKSMASPWTPCDRLFAAPHLRAGDGTRTRDNRLGKPMLYQLSYARKPWFLHCDRVSYVCRVSATTPATTPARFKPSPRRIPGHQPEANRPHAPYRCTPADERPRTLAPPGYQPANVRRGDQLSKKDVAGPAVTPTSTCVHAVAKAPYTRRADRPQPGSAGWGRTLPANSRPTVCPA